MNLKPLPEGWQAATELRFHDETLGGPFHLVHAIKDDEIIGEGWVTGADISRWATQLGFVEQILRETYTAYRRPVTGGCDDCAGTGIHYERCCSGAYGCTCNGQMVAVGTCGCVPD